MPAIREPESKRTGDLASVLAALETRCSADGSPKRRLARAQARGVLTLVLIGLIVASAFELLTLTPTARTPAVGTRASIVFSNAQSGACLGWPPDAPDKPSFVQCRDDHMFEVAKPVGMNSFGEPCQLAVREYLGTRYDPNSRFTISVLWAGDADGTKSAPQSLLCGLQLLGPEGRAIPFKGRIADLDQSKVWPVGTCLGIDSSNRSTDIPVDCAAPHALEVTGAVSLAQNFPGDLPADADQRAFIDGACTRMADGYLGAGTMPDKDLELGYEPLSAASWSAGSKQVSCSVGKPAERGWTPMTGSVRSNSPADLQPTAAPPPSPSPSPSPPPSPSPSPSPAAPPPPPVYEEPLVPVGAAPASPSPEPSPVSLTPEAPTTVTSPPEPTSTPPAPSPTPSPSPSQEPLGPPPGPAEAPSENTGPPPGILEIPGLPPITLPGYVPPEPPPPAPVPLGPPPGPV